MKYSTQWSIGLLLAFFAASCACQDAFSEELLTAWLTPHHLLVHLRFDQGTTASRHHTSFPHAVQHLAATLPLHEVELSLTTGRWRHTEWGWPLVQAKPVGAVLDARFHSGLPAGALAGHWAALVNALSGLSCASLGLLRGPATVSGGHIRLQELFAGAESKAAANSSSSKGSSSSRDVRPGAASGQRLHASLPHEQLCTENLTPWLRLLPCRDQAGLASLIRHRPTVFGAEYVSLGLLLERRSTASGRRGVRLVQSFTLVLHTAEAGPQRQQQRKPGRGARSDLRPGVQDRDPDLDLEWILGSRVDYFCPAALRSQVFVSELAGSAPLGLNSCSSSDLQHGSCPAEAAATAAVSGLGDYGGGGCGGGGDGDLASPGSAAAAPSVDASILLLPENVLGSADQDAAADTSRALPPLRRYDTLDLLELRGHALGLTLPRPNPTANPSPGMPPAAQTAGLPGAGLLVERYVTGAGLLRGGMVLRVRRSEGLLARLAVAGAAAAGCGSGSGRDSGPGAVCALSVMCVHQVFPWYVRPWLHTLALLYDGQGVPLRPRIVAQRVRPAVARASPGLLDLCLRVPVAVAEVQLRAAFSKAFLTAFEYPPDAHRGFDVPAATVSYVDPLHAPQLQWRAVRSQSLPPDVAEGSTGGGAASGSEVLTSPLLAALSRGPVQQVYTPGLLVPLAAPDFSMPYNVICLSSTVLAVFFGVLLNLITRRGSRDPNAAGAPTGKAKVSMAGKALEAVLMLGLFAALALYLDAELRAQAEGLMAGLGLQLRAKPHGCSAARC